MIFWYITLSILLLVTILASYYCIKFALVLLKIQDALEASLDAIDEKHQKMSEILERPLFYDSPEVRQVLDEIDNTRVLLHEIAYALSSNFNEEKTD